MSVQSRWFCLVLLVLLIGCEPARAPRRAARATADSDTSESRYLGWVTDVLGQLEDFNDGDMMQQVTERLNLWVESDHPQAEWEADPLIAGLPTECREIGAIKRLSASEFSLLDATYLQECMWIKSASELARQGEVEEGAAVRKIFDWVVRNVALEAPAEDRVPHYVAEVLWQGAGTAAERAWVLIELLRQQKFSAVLLAAPDDKAENQCLVGVLLGDNLYLYDLELGLPVSDTLEAKPFADLKSSPAILKSMQLDSDHPYRLTAKNLDQLQVIVAAGPSALSPRMKVVEANLAGKARLRLSVAPTALVAKVRAVIGGEGGSLWPYPMQVIRQKIRPSERLQQAIALELAPFRVPLDAPKRDKKKEDRTFDSLDRGLSDLRQGSDTTATRIAPGLIYPFRKGRFQHICGILDGAEGAKQQYVLTRNQRFLEMIDAMAATARDPKNQLQHSDRADRLKLQEVVHRMNQTATFWTGLIMFGEGEYDSALHFFDLALQQPQGRWKESARYNKARTREAQGATAEAAALLRASESAQRTGDLLRAERLTRLAGKP